MLHHSASSAIAENEYIIALSEGVASASVLSCDLSRSILLLEKQSTKVKVNPDSTEWTPLQLIHTCQHTNDKSLVWYGLSVCANLHLCPVPARHRDLDICNRCGAFRDLLSQRATAFPRPLFFLGGYMTATRIRVGSNEL